MNESAPFKVGDKVKVSAEATGYGIAPIGIVSDVELFANEWFISIDFIEPFEVGGRRGCCVCNLGMLERL